MTSEPLSRSEFEQLLAEHGQLIRLTNELEYHLYQVGAEPTPEHVAECQQAGGALICQLRNVLFRHDQQVLPVLEALIPPEQARHATEVEAGNIQVNQGKARGSAGRESAG